MTALLVELSAEAVEDIARRAAEIVLAEVDGDRGGWPEWMAVETAASYLDSSPERVRKLIARRQIPFVQQGAGCRIFLGRRDLDEWMRQGRT